MIEMRSRIRRIKNNSWRWQLRKRRIFRWFQYFDWKNDLPSFRWLVLLFVVGLSVVLIDALFCWVTDCGYVWFSFCSTKTLLAKVAQANTPSSATVLLALYSAPAAYIIWWFRDANNRQQIENQRKDVNLKDFQRLAEWAAGMHLPEDKVVESEKKTNNLETKNIANNSEEKTSSTTETNRSVESFIAPNNHILHTPSRREGAASLQVAAIYQLQAFLQGDYGKQFQRPAFQLLKSIWLALVKQHLEESYSVRKFNLLGKLNLGKLNNEMGTPIGRAINIAIGTKQGWVLRQHAEDLPGAVFAGYNSLGQPLELDDLKLQRIQLQGSDLRDASFEGSYLRDASFQGSDLRGASFQGSNLEGADFHGANLEEVCFQSLILKRANFQCSNLKGANFQRSNLVGTNFQDSNLSNVNLQGAQLGGQNSKYSPFKIMNALEAANLQDVNLSNADLRGANLEGVNLQRANLEDAKLQNADLRGANLQDAKLGGVNLCQARLEDANLEGVVFLEVTGLMFMSDKLSANFENAKTSETTQVLVYIASPNSFLPDFMIDPMRTFDHRKRLRDKNKLVLPEILYKQLFTKPTEYAVINSNGKKEKKFGVGLRTEF